MRGNTPVPLPAYPSGLKSYCCSPRSLTRSLTGLLSGFSYEHTSLLLQVLQVLLHCPECSSSETTGLATSWQSRPASAPPSREIPTIRKNSPSLSSPLPLTWHHSSSEHLSPPDSRLLSFPHQCHLPLGPPCSLCKWHPLESCKQGSWAPLGKQRFIQMGTCFAPTKEVCNAYPLNR